MKLIIICHNYNIKDYNRITYNLNTDISVIIFNIRSFNKNINNFLILLDTLYNKPDIIILTETWLINTDPSIYFNNYNIFLNNRTLKIKKRGGGVAILVNKSLDVCVIDELTISIIDDIEILSIQIKNTTKHIQIISAIYRSPNSNIDFFNDLFYNIYSTFLNNEIYICGDFNIDLSKCSLISNNFKYILTQLGLTANITIPTHYSNSTIDNILSNNDHITNNGTIDTDITDHCILFFIFTSFSRVKKCDNKVMYIRNFNQQNIEYLKNDFININWQIVLSEMTDPSICYNNFINILNDIVNKNCPLIKKKAV